MSTTTSSRQAAIILPSSYWAQITPKAYESGNVYGPTIFIDSADRSIINSIIPGGKRMESATHIKFPVITSETDMWRCMCTNVLVVILRPEDVSKNLSIIQRHLFEERRVLVCQYSPRGGERPKDLPEKCIWLGTYNHFECTALKTFVDCAGKADEEYYISRSVRFQL